MDALSAKTPRLHEVLGAFRFVWTNQRAIFKRLACPLLFIMAYFVGLFILQFLGHGMTQLIGPDGMPVPTTQHPAESVNIIPLIITLVTSVMVFMGSLMMPVRLFRFMLGHDDPFFSFGRREWRMLLNILLVFLTVFVPVAIVMIGSFALFMPLIGIILCVPYALWMLFRLAFLFPALSIDRPTSFKSASAQMSGVLGRFMTTIFVLILVTLVATLLAGAVPGAILAVLYLATKGAIGLLFPYVLPLLALYYLWFATLIGAVKTRVVANFYQRQVLDKD